MEEYLGIVSWCQSNGQGQLPISNAPAGMFTGNVVNGVYVHKTGTGIVPFNVTDVGALNNGFTINVVGSSSSGCYSWILEFAWKLSVQSGQKVLIAAAGAGGSCMSLKTLLNGSHNIDTATLAASFPTTPRLHTDLDNKIDATITQVGLDGDTINWVLCLSDQEEADFSTPSTRQVDQLAKIDYVRTKLSLPNLKFIWCSRAMDSDFFSQYMLAENRDVADADSDNIFFSNIGGGTFDGAHFNAETSTSITNNALYKFNGTQLPEEVVNLEVPNIQGKEYNAIQKSIEASGISDEDQLQAIDDYITGTQSIGVWTKIIAASLCLGNDYTFNIKNIGFRNFTLAGVTQGVNGFVFDGATHLNANFRGSDIATIMSSDLCVFGYVKDDSIGLGNQTVAGWNQTEGVLFRLFSNFLGSINSVNVQRANAAIGASSIVGDRLVTNSGLILGNVKDGKIRVFKNEKMFGQIAYTANEFVNNLLQFGIDPAGGGTPRYLNNIMPYLGYGHGFTIAQIEAHSALIDAIMVNLGRQATPQNPIPLFSTLLAYAQSQGDTLPNDPFLTKLETFMDTYGPGFLRNGVALFIAANENASAGTFATRNILNPLTHLMTFPAGVTFGVNGWTLNSVDQYGDCSFNLAVNGAEKYLLNQACRFAWLHAGGVDGDAIDGLVTGSRNNMLWNNSINQRINSAATALPSAFDFTGTGLKLICREDEANVVLRNNATEGSRAVNASTVGLLNENQLMGRSSTNFGGGTFKAYSPGFWRLTAQERADLYTGLTALFT